MHQIRQDNQPFIAAQMLKATKAKEPIFKLAQPDQNKKAFSKLFNEEYA